MATQTTANPSAPRWHRSLDSTVTLAAVGFWLIVLWWMSTQSISRVRYGTVFVGGILTVYALNEAKESVVEHNWIDTAVLLSATAVLITASGYFFANFETVYLQRQGFATEHEYILARVLIIALLYLTWREFGNLFLGLVVGVLVYAVYGNVVPGVLGHAGMTELTLLQALVTDLYGFYGSLTQLTASWIAPFLLYAGLLFAYGAFDLILRLAIVGARYVDSGVAQTAVLASAVIGSINGSYTANAAMTGSFTIPTMQESGMAKHRAAGIEAVASTAGQVLPPVMGASAFVMASYLGVAYLDVLVAGLMPAAILVVSIAIAVHYTAVSQTTDQELVFSNFFEERLTTGERISETIRFGVPFAILVYFLGVAQYTVMTSALYTIFAMITTGVLVPVAQQLTPGTEGSLLGELHHQLTNTIRGFRRGAIILAPIAIILVAISGVVNLLSTTGVPAKIALLMINLTGGVLLFAVLLGMLVAIIMGVGLPTVAAYVIVAILIVPTFVSDFGVPEITAHYTMFYAAILSGITPPIATAAMVTAGIAGANFWRTCWVALKIAAPLFILPIAFVYNPGLVSMTPAFETLFRGGLVMGGAVMMIYGLTSPFEWSLPWLALVRFLFVSLGILVMVVPTLAVKLGGLVIFVGALVGRPAFSDHPLLSDTLKVSPTPETSVNSPFSGVLSSIRERLSAVSEFRRAYAVPSVRILEGVAATVLIIGYLWWVVTYISAGSLPFV